MRRVIGIVAVLIFFCAAWAPASERDRLVCRMDDAPKDICVLDPMLSQTEGSCPAGTMDCPNTDFCCPPQFPMYCAYDQRTGESNKCLAADSDEDLYYLQNCSYYLQCRP